MPATKKSCSLDDAKTSILTEHNISNVSYRFKDLLEYCRAKGLSPTDLSNSELAEFEVKRDNRNCFKAQVRLLHHKKPSRFIHKAIRAAVVEPKKTK